MKLILFVCTFKVSKEIPLQRYFAAYGVQIKTEVSITECVTVFGPYYDLEHTHVPIYLQTIGVFKARIISKHHCCAKIFCMIVVMVA